MLHSGRWLVIVSPYKAGGGLRRARGRRGCAGECAINCCHHHQTWPNRAKPNREARAGKRGCTMAAGTIALAVEASRVACAAGRPSHRGRSTESESRQRAAFDCRSRIQVCLQQSHKNSQNVPRCNEQQCASCHQFASQSHSGFAVPCVLSAFVRRAPRAQNRPRGSVRPWPPGARRA